MKVLHDAGLVHQVGIIKGLFHDEEVARQNGDTSLGNRITTEIRDREGADDDLDDRIDQLQQSLQDAIDNVAQDYATKAEVSLIPKFAIEVVQSLPT